MVFFTILSSVLIYADFDDDDDINNNNNNIEIIMFFCKCILHNAQFSLQHLMYYLIYSYLLLI